MKQEHYFVLTNAKENNLKKGRGNYNLINIIISF